MKLLQQFKKLKRRITMYVINYFALQIEFDWITIDEVPEKYREKVQQLVDASKV